jgi:hypothetical protein
VSAGDQIINDIKEIIKSIIEDILFIIKNLQLKKIITYEARDMIQHSMFDFA